MAYKRWLISKYKMTLKVSTIETTAETSDATGGEQMPLAA